MKSLADPSRLTAALVGQGALLLQCAQILLERNFRLCLIVSDDVAVTRWSSERGIKCCPNSYDVPSEEEQSPFDYLFSIVNYSVLSEKFLRLARVDAINYHDAPLPLYAGLHATTWALINQETMHAISWHRMSQIIDGGDIYKQRAIVVSDSDTAFSINGKCYAAAIDAFAELADDIVQGCARAVPQELGKRTYFGKYERPFGAGLLDWSKSAKELHALVRALDFGVYLNPLGLPKIVLKGQILLVAEVLAVAGQPHPAAAGVVTAVSPKLLRVATESGELEVHRLMTLDGAPVALSELIARGDLRVGLELGTPDFGARALLTKANRLVCRHEDFWVQRLSRLQPYVLPFLRKPRAAAAQAQGRVVDLFLPEGLSLFLSARGVDQAEFLGGAFCAFLARMADLPTFDLATEAEDLGTDFPELVQIFASLVPARIEIDFKASLLFAVQQASSQLAEAKKHLTFTRDICIRHPSLRHLANLRRPQRLPVVIQRTFPGNRVVLAPGLELILAIDKNLGRCEWIYDETLFDAETIKRATGHFLTFLNAFVIAPDAPVEMLPLLTNTERDQLIYAYNPSLPTRSTSSLPLDGEATLHRLFEERVKQFPDAIALVCDNERLTYSELNKRANRLASCLRQNGVGPDVLVGICMNRSNDLVIGLLAILKAGGAYLPIDLAYPADRLAFMLADALAPVLLTETALTAKLPVTTATILCIDAILSEPTAGEIDQDPAIASSADHLAYVIYTSGTTGKPKGTLITHRNVVRLFSSTEHWYSFNEHDVWTLFHSSAFDFSVWEIWGALLYGGKVVVVPFMVSRSPETFYDLLAEEKVTVLNQTPSAFRQLILAEETVGQKPLALRYVIFGGEALEMQSLRPWFDRHGDRQPLLVNMYGITETTVHVTYRPLSKTDLTSGSVIGVPIPDLQVYILDRQLQPTPLGIVGEMYVSGAGLARGYLRRPDLTTDRFLPDCLTGRANSRLYKTGDLARFLPGRDIEYLGRIDHQVKIRGFRIELGEIESVLCQHPVVRESLVLARDDGAGGKRLIAYIVTHSRPPAVSELRDHLGKKMPDYMVPASYVFLEKFPLTTNGKIDRVALPEPAQERPELAASYVKPRTPIEQKLAEIWSRVLSVGQVGVHDNFFELGGDSILSIQVISLSRQAGFSLSPKLLFQFPTIAELGEAVKPLIELPKTNQSLVEGSAPLTPIQHWFVEQELNEPQWYNQAFLFTVNEPLKLDPLKQALLALERHHDALRLRLVGGASAPLPTFATPSAEAPLEKVDLTTVSDDQLESALMHIGTNAQGNLNCVHGPLWRVVYCDLGSSRPHRLLFVIHHLAVDGVSWRILLEDLERAYEQSLNAATVSLPAKTLSVKNWSERLTELAQNIPPALGRDYWQALAAHKTFKLPLELNDGANTEGSTKTITVRLEVSETEALLKQAPRAYNTQINDLLLTALGRTLKEWTGFSSIFLNLEGHGREDLFDGVDLSRTVGWFTSIYPVELNLTGKSIGDEIKSVKEQLRGIPARGVGFGILRYLARDEILRSAGEPEIVFNYLGQLDHLVEKSQRFKFAPEPTGSWHSPIQQRRHAIEINCAVVRRRLEVWWTYSESLHCSKTMTRLAASFAANLREVVTHCAQAGVRGATPSDFPLAGLNQADLDKLLATTPNLEDVYALSPIQSLFYSAGTKDIRAIIDHWQCILSGPLDLHRFRSAWELLIDRHSVLRTSFHSAALKEAVQVVHRKVALPWVVDDWRDQSLDQQEKRWQELIVKEREIGIVLDRAPLHRITLVRITEDRYKFLWIAPALLLDGWSWPVVFRDLSNFYDALSRPEVPLLQPVRPYRECVAWLRQRSQSDDQQFWRQKLKGFTKPTPLISEPGDLPLTVKRQSAEWCKSLDVQATARLFAFARQLKITPSTLLLWSWSLVLARLSGQRDVIFGAAFSGRSPEMRDSANIVGPFVNNLPIRVQVSSDDEVERQLKMMHDQLIGANPHQFAPLAQIQSWSEVPWRDRLFESIVVVQNYEVDEAARRLGVDVDISDFSAPIHSNFPLLVLVEPAAQLRVTLIYDRRELSATRVEAWGDDFLTTLNALPFAVGTVATLLDRLTPPTSKPPGKPRFRVQSLNYIPPQTELEHSISKVWKEMFQEERISVEENLFDLGAHSLLVTRLHARLCEALGRIISFVDLFQYPTIRSLARFLSSGATDTSSTEIKSRAQLQREALARLRRPVVKS